MSGATIVSCFINLNDKVNKSLDWYISKGKELLNVDANMIFYVDEMTYPLIKPLRNRENTHFILMNLQDLPFYKYKDTITKNRIGKSMYISSRNTPDYFILVASKLEMLKRAAVLNPFDSSHFIWIDFGIFGQQYTQKGMIEEVLCGVRDKFSCCYIHYRPKSFIKSYHQMDYCGIAAGVLSGNIKYITEVYNLFKNKFIELVSSGKGHSEEQILTEIQCDNPDLFEVYYGDYCSIISNYVIPKHSISSILKNFIINARADANNFLAYSACKQVDYSMSQGHAKLSNEEKITFYDEYFITAWYVSRQDCLKIIHQLNDEMAKSEELCKLFSEKLDHLTNNLDFIIHLLDPKKNVKVTGSISEDKIRELISEGYRVFLYTEDVAISEKYLLINNPIVRPNTKIKNIEYDLIL